MQRLSRYDSSLWITNTLYTYHKVTTNTHQRSSCNTRHKMNKAWNLLWAGISELCICDKNNVENKQSITSFETSNIYPQSQFPHKVLRFFNYVSVSFPVSLTEGWLFISCTGSFKGHFQNANSTQLLFYFNESRFGFYFISDATSSLPQAMFKLIGMNSIRTSLTTPRGTVQRGGHSPFTSTTQTGRRCWHPGPPNSFQFRLLGFHTSFVTLFIYPQLSAPMNSYWVRSRRRTLFEMLLNWVPRL